MIMKWAPALFAFLFAMNLEAKSPEALAVADLARKINVMDISGKSDETTRNNEKLLNRLKKTLPELVRVNLNALGNSRSVSDALRAAVAKDLKEAGIGMGDITNPRLQQSLFGYLPANQDKQTPQLTLDGLVANRIPAHDDMIGVAMYVGVPCGSDAAFYLYEYKQNKWNLILAQFEPRLDLVYGWENLNCGFADIKQDGKFYVVLTYNPIWCSSNWTSLYLSLLRPSGDPFNPKVLKTIRKSYWRAAGYYLNVEKNHVKIRYPTYDEREDRAGFGATQIDEYAIENGTLKPFDWKIDKHQISVSPVHILYQDKSFEKEAGQIAKKLEGKGFKVKTRMANRYYPMPNSICYFRPDDDKLANYIGKLTFDIYRASWTLDEYELAPKDKFKEGVSTDVTVEIWLCDSGKNEKLAPPKKDVASDGNR
jgi:hypothetical protein